MGLGKTLQTLSLFQYLEEERAQTPGEEPRPYLVVCPLSVVGSWVSEATKWTPELNVLLFHGSRNERIQLKKTALSTHDRFGNPSLRANGKRKKNGTTRSFDDSPEAAPYNVVVTSYETFAAEKAWFKSAYAWKFVVLDEGHKIKNDMTHISTALQGLRAEHRLILTGTPLQNNLLEMWALLHWLYPMVFTPTTSELFKTSFDLSKGSVRTSVLDDTRRLLELICIRRLKDSDNVNLGLPPKTEILLYVPLTPYQRIWYTRLLTKTDNSLLTELFRDSGEKERAVQAAEAIEAHNADTNLPADQHPETTHGEQWAAARAVLANTIERKTEEGAPKNLWQKLMNLVMQLRKVCSHPYLLPDAVPEPYTFGDHVVLASGKYIVLQKLVQNLVLEKGKKMIIFSGFTKNLDLTEELLDLLGAGSAFKYARFDGSTPRARRNLAIRLFNTSPEYKVILISTRAGGLGINLTSATEVVFLDEDWNPQVTLQAEARAHRIGQINPVTIYKLCTQGTVEEQMLGRIRKKLYLSTKITESMQNIHDQARKGKKKGQSSASNETPQLDNSTLKSLIRRGAQTLAHQSIDVGDMLAWDFSTVIEKCRDKPADVVPNADTGAGGSEEEWLSMMEKVECAIFEGKQHARQKRADFDKLSDDATRADRRKDKNTTVMIDGFAVSKESMSCADWEAVPTLAGKDPRLSEPQRRKKEPINHQDHCQVCFDEGEVVCCRLCPRSYHEGCLDDASKARLNGRSISFICSQHSCVICQRNTTDAGGMLYRCRWCYRSWCEDCLGTDDVELIGDTLLEYETLGYAPNDNAFYICCPPCCQQRDNDEEVATFMQDMQSFFEEEHAKAIEANNEETGPQIVTPAVRSNTEAQAAREEATQRLENSDCYIYDFSVIATNP